MADSNNNFRYYLFLHLILHLLLELATGEIENTVQHCCSLGSRMATKDNHCNGISVSTPVQDIEAESQSICLSTMQLCCVHDLRTIQCEDGKKAARSGRICPDEDNDRKYCCEACKLGIISSSMSLGCASQEPNFGCTWNSAYESCCNSNFPKSNINLTDYPSTSSLPDPVQDHICDLYPGELCAHICIPTPGSYSCACYEGFTLIADGKSCAQNLAQDRCKLSNPCHQICRDTGMAIECSCRTGYELHSNKTSCLDVDECALGQHYCRDDEICHNEPGGFSCEKSKDIEVPAFPDLNNSISTPRSNEQQPCPLGFNYNSVNHQCTDIDECLENRYLCHTETETCVNMQGGYQCVPKKRQPPPTEPSRCNTGFEWNSIHNGCADINECEEVAGDSPCDSNQICENIVGSYRCLCKTGYQLDSLTKACVDINECQVDLHNCLLTQRCDNTIGSFQCVRYTNCGTGYTLNAQTGQCEDDDECTLRIDNCRSLGPDYQCRNTLGSFRCERKSNEKSCNGKCSSTSIQSCPRGMEPGENEICVDVNECEKGLSRCGPNQRCVNTHGGYMCTNLLNCESGFRFNEAKTRCLDIDECTEQNRLCDHSCINLWGSYRCTCEIGYKLHSDNRTCIDLNECELYKDRRLCIGYCVNQPGSYSCQCPNGYVLGNDGASCQDIDECKDGKVCNGQDEVCLNMRGSYRCNSISCPSGYVRDAQHKNRCKREQIQCAEDDADCRNQPMTQSFNFITLVSNYTIPPSGLSLFTMTGPAWSSTSVDFDLALKMAHSPPGIPSANDNYFHLQHIGRNQMGLKLVRPLIGPQDIQLQVTMTFYYNGNYGGKSLSQISLFVSQYEF